MNLNALNLNKFLLLLFIPFTIKAKVVSGIDARYQLSRFHKKYTAMPRSPGVSFYQKVLSRTLGSECKLFPNDSQFSQLMMANCPKAAAVLKSMQRFYLEPDAPNYGLDVLVQSRILYVDLPLNCDLL